MASTLNSMKERTLRVIGLDRGKSVAMKLEAIRAAAKHEFPTGDIDSMLAEIDQGLRAVPSAVRKGS